MVAVRIAIHGLPSDQVSIERSRSPTTHQFLCSSQLTPPQLFPNQPCDFSPAYLQASVYLLYLSRYRQLFDAWLTWRWCGGDERR